jgi:hypothetical protein
MHFRELDVASLRRMELRYTASGNSLNGLAVYLRSLRALFNKARQGGVIPLTPIISAKSKPINPPWIKHS